MHAREVFLSYAEEDRDFAKALADALNARKCSTWTYKTDAVVGESFLTSIHNAIKACRLFVFVGSTHSIASPVVIKELEQALVHAKVVFPLRLDITHEQLTTFDGRIAVPIGTTVSMECRMADVSDVAEEICNRLRHLDDARPTLQPGHATRQGSDSQTAGNTGLLGRIARALCGRVSSARVSSVTALPGIVLFVTSYFVGVMFLRHQGREIGYALSLNWSANLIVVFPLTVKLMLEALAEMEKALSTFDMYLPAFGMSGRGLWHRRLSRLLPWAIIILIPLTLWPSLWQWSHLLSANVEQLKFHEFGEYVSWGVGWLIEGSRAQRGSNIAFALAAAVMQALVFAVLLLFLAILFEAFGSVLHEVEKETSRVLVSTDPRETVRGSVEKLNNKLVAVMLLVGLCMYLARLQASYLTSDHDMASIAEFVGILFVTLPRRPDSGLFTFSGVMTWMMTLLYCVVVSMVAVALNRLAQMHRAATSDSTWPSARWSRMRLAALGVAMMLCLVFQALTPATLLLTVLLAEPWLRTRFRAVRHGGMNAT